MHPVEYFIFPHMPSTGSSMELAKYNPSQRLWNNDQCNGSVILKDLFVKYELHIKYLDVTYFRAVLYPGLIDFNLESSYFLLFDF